MFGFAVSGNYVWEMSVCGTENCFYLVSMPCLVLAGVTLAEYVDVYTAFPMKLIFYTMLCSCNVK